MKSWNSWLSPWKGDKASRRVWTKWDKVLLPAFLCVCLCILTMFLCCIKTELWAKSGSSQEPCLDMTWFDLHIIASGCTQRCTHTHTLMGMLECTLFRTSLSCSISLSFCSRKPSSWWMVISASASRLVRSWSSSVALDDRPLLCNISSNFFMDSSLFEKNRFISLELQQEFPEIMTLYIADYLYLAVSVCFCVSILSSISSTVFLRRKSSLTCRSNSLWRRRKFSSVISWGEMDWPPRRPVSE